MQELDCDENGVVGDILNAPDFGTDYQAALRWMRRPYYLHGERYAALQEVAERRRAYPPLVVWERAVVARFRRLGVPLYARCYDAERYGYGVQLAHCVMLRLPRICWQLIRHVGEELAGAHALDVVWGGHEDPHRWTMREWESWRWSPPARQDFLRVIE